MKFLLLFPPAAFAAAYFLHPRSSLPKSATATTRAPTIETIAAKPSAGAAILSGADLSPAARPAPPASLADVLKLASAYHRAAAARLYFDSLSVGDLPRAMQELLALPTAAENEVVTNLFRSWGARAPEQAGRAALSLPPPFDPQEMAYAAIRVWARFSPDAALQWAIANLDEKTRAGMKAYVGNLKDIQQESLVDPAERIRQILPTYKRADFAKLRRAFVDIIRTDPLEAQRQFTALPEERKYPNLAIPVFAGLVKSDAQEAAKFFAQLSPGNAQWALTAVESGLPSTAVPAFREYALSLPTGDSRSALLGVVAKTMTLMDTENAAAFVATLPPGERFAGMYDFWEFSAAADPRKTAEHLVRMRTEAGAEASAEIPAADVLRRGAMRFPEKGAEAALLLPPEERDDLFEAVAPQWVSRDANAAFAWAAKVPDEKARASAVYQIAAHAAEHDATQVAQWAGDLAPGPARDSAARALAEQVFDTDPEGALVWARSLSTAEGRVAALRSAVNRWRWRNRVATEEWLKDAALTPEERAGLTKNGGADLRE